MYENNKMGGPRSLTMSTGHRYTVGKLIKKTIEVHSRIRLGFGLTGVIQIAAPSVPREKTVEVSIG